MEKAARSGGRREAAGKRGGEEADGDEEESGVGGEGEVGARQRVCTPADWVNGMREEEGTDTWAHNATSHSHSSCVAMSFKTTVVLTEGICEWFCKLRGSGCMVL